MKKSDQYLMGFQPTLRLLIVLLLALFCLSACKSTEDRVEDYLADNEILPVKNALTATDQMAQSWEEGAFLVSVHISFGGSVITNNLNVLYQSPTRPGLNFMISIMNGQLNSQVPFFSGTTRSGISDDWLLDSGEVLRAAITQPDSLKLLRRNVWEACGSMKLEKSVHFPEKPAVWRILLSECSTMRETIEFFIDPMTGERLADNSK